MNLHTDNIQELERNIRNSRNPMERFVARQKVKQLSAQKCAGGLRYASGDQEEFSGLNRVSYQYQVMGSEMRTATIL